MRVRILASAVALSAIIVGAVLLRAQTAPASGIPDLSGDWAHPVAQSLSLADPGGNKRGQEGDIPYQPWALKKLMSWLRVGFVGENVKRATVATVVGKSSTLNATYVGFSEESVMLFSDDSAPVLVSRAVKVTSACGVGATPLLKTLLFDSGSLMLNCWVCPASTEPSVLPLAVRLTTITGKVDS